MSMTLAALAVMAIGEGAKFLQQNQGAITRVLQQNQGTIIRVLQQNSKNIAYTIKSPEMKQSIMNAENVVSKKTSEFCDYINHMDDQGGWKRKR